MDKDPSLEMEFPKYRLPWRLVLEILLSVLFLRKRTFRQDAQVLIKGISSFQQIGSLPGHHDNRSGWLITFNHYHRPGFDAWWLGICLAAIFPQDINFVMTSAWTYPDKLRSRVLTPITRWIFTRVSKIYGFTSMPPMPPRLEDTVDRAIAVRSLSRYIKSRISPAVALAPEGMDSTSSGISLPPPGVGRMIAYLSRQNLAILPVGIFECCGKLTLKIGSPYNLEPHQCIDPKTLDQAVSIRVMTAITDCLPDHLRLNYPLIPSPEEEA